MNAPYTVETIGGRNYKRANGVAVLATPEESAMFAYVKHLEEIVTSKEVAKASEVQTPAPSVNGKPKR